MGLTRQFALRAALYFLATVLGVAGSLVLVRKLDPEDYAFYQGLTKRAFLVGWMPFALTALVLYRRLAGGREGALPAFLFQTLLTLLSMTAAAVAWSLLAGASSGLLLLSTLALMVLGLWSALRFLLDIVRPVRVGVAMLFSRLLLSLLIVASVYFMGLGLMGALSSFIIALGVGSLYSAYLVLTGLGLRGASPRPLLLRLPGYLKQGAREAARIALYYREVNVINMANGAIGGLDVFLVASLRGLAFTAPFLAFHSIVSLLQETLGWASRLFARNLITGEAKVGDVARTMRIVILTASPLLILVAAFPTHVAMILNPQYAGQSRLLTIIALGYLAFMVHSFLANTAIGSISVDDPARERRLLTRMYRRILAARLTYITLAVTAALLIRGDETTYLLWGGAFLAEAVLMATASLSIMAPENSRLLARSALTSTAKTLTVGIFLSLAFHQLLPPPQPLFWEALRLLTPYFIGYLTLYYLALLTLDKELRTALTKLLRTAPPLSRTPTLR